MNFMMLTFEVFLHSDSTTEYLYVGLLTFSIYRTICRLVGKLKSFDAGWRVVLVRGKSLLSAPPLQLVTPKYIRIYSVGRWEIQIYITVSHGVCRYEITMLTLTFYNSTCMIFSEKYRNVIKCLILITSEV
jgi:hypothetical protein